MKRRISVTEMLKRKQMYKQQLYGNGQFKSIIYSEENELSMGLSDWLQGHES